MPNECPAPRPDLRELLVQTRFLFVFLTENPAVLSAVRDVCLSAQAEIDKRDSARLCSCDGG
jgi:hypothetical protein